MKHDRRSQWPNGSVSRQVVAMLLAVTCACVTCACGARDGGMLDKNMTSGAAGWDGVPEAGIAADYGSLDYDGMVPDWNTENYAYIGENGFMSVAASPLSTFAADVDTASYANVRRMILQGIDIPPDAVRVEEFVNYFKYDYPEPTDGEPFSVTTEISPCPWNADTEILRIGLKAKDIDLSDRVPSNFVFLVDVSGSMDSSDKLPLVKQAFIMLTENLGPDDRISMVTYAGTDKIVLDGVTGSDGPAIRTAMEDVMAGGGTNGSKGIETAYELAEKHFIEGGNNRVILATDGDLNMGVTSTGDLTRLIESKRESGVYLSVLGFGTGNIKDDKMEALADNGNGNYHYVDSVLEAKKVLVEEMGGTLFAVAEDVKFQVEFNPARVKGYRQIGYENRSMAAEDFADDSKDGGEIGAGHRVTVLYEIVPSDSAMEISDVDLKYGSTGSSPESNDWLTVSIRYKAPGGPVSKLLEYPVGDDAVIEEPSPDTAFAECVAGFAMLLRESEYAGDLTYDGIASMLSGLGTDDEYKREFAYLVDRVSRGQ